jgi:phosphonopyruvate decarboxylase
LIDCAFFYNALIQQGIDFFSGVPDSTLKSLCAYITDHADSGRHIIAANEGGAIALACGYHLATDRTGLVYMQNSGQGNAVNSLVSLVDSDVYSVPVLLLIGWRGEPGKHDEPQHIKQGRITLSFLDMLEIPYRILSNDTKEANDCLNEVIDIMQQRSGPTALIARKGIFEPYQMRRQDDSQYDLTREEAIKEIIDNLEESDIVVATTGKTSRELYEYRDSINGDHRKDFLTVGSMGHCSQIALGIALSKKDRQVFCLDGDGALIMHMGALAVIGSNRPKNFKHIVLNNGCHDSVGGQPTYGFSIDIMQITQACGYTLALQAKTASETVKAMQVLKATRGPVLLEVRVRPGSRDDLGRPALSPVENKEKFMRFLHD